MHGEENSLEEKKKREVVIFVVERPYHALHWGSAYTSSWDHVLLRWMHVDITRTPIPSTRHRSRALITLWMDSRIVRETVSPIVNNTSQTARRLQSEREFRIKRNSLSRARTIQNVVASLRRDLFRSGSSPPSLASCTIRFCLRWRTSLNRKRLERDKACERRGHERLF